MSGRKLLVLILSICFWKGENEYAGKKWLALGMAVLLTATMLPGGAVLADAGNESGQAVSVSEDKEADSAKENLTGTDKDGGNAENAADKRINEISGSIFSDEKDSKADLEAACRYVTENFYLSEDITDINKALDVQRGSGTVIDSIFSSLLDKAGIRIEKDPLTDNTGDVSDDFSQNIIISLNNNKITCRKMTYTVRCGESDEKVNLLFASDEISFRAISEAVKTDPEVRFYRTCSDEKKESTCDAGVRIKSAGDTLLSSPSNVLGSGYCGDTSNNQDGKNISWTLTNDGTLTLKGSGKMDFYNTTDSFWGFSCPVSGWFYLSDKVTNVQIGEGITVIGSAAFCNTNITSVTLPSTIKEIQQSAFSGCKNLKSITLNNGLETIGAGVFNNTAIGSITVPDSVKEINASNFRQIKLDKWKFSGNGNLIVSDGILYDKNKTTVFVCSTDKKGVIELPSTVNTIKSCAFEYCSLLQRVVLPSGLKTIGEGAFNLCSGITEIDIPDSVTEMGYSAFANCTNLKKVIVGNGLKELDNSVFAYSDALKDLTIGKNVKKIGYGAFEKSGLTNVIIPDSVTDIDGYAFWACKSLTSVNFGKNVQSIGAVAFYDTDIKNVTLPSSVLKVEHNAFPEGATITKDDTLIADDKGGYITEKNITKISYEVQYDQSSARSMLSELNSFRTGSEAWYYSKDGSKAAQPGLKGLVYDYELEKTAMERAADIAVRFSHSRPDESDCFSIFPDNCPAMGENIAYGFSSSTDTMNQWKETNYNYYGQGHRRNMLSGDFNAVGIAHVKYKGQDFWVQDFGYRSNPDTKARAVTNGSAKHMIIFNNENISNAGKVSMDTSGIALDAKGRSASLPVAAISNFVCKYSVWNGTGTANNTHDEYVKIDNALSENGWHAEDPSVALVKDGKVTALTSRGKTNLYTYIQGTKYSVSFEVGYPAVQYRTHIENIGWENKYTLDGGVSGTTGEAKRLESIQIKIANDKNLGVKYHTHVQDYGWQDWKNNDQKSGTEGQAKRLEAIQIELTGSDAAKYDIYYRVHAQNYGWLGWAKNGEKAGTAGLAYRLEAIQIELVDKNGGKAPESSGQAFHEYKSSNVKYRAHVQDIGNQNWVMNGQQAGTSGQSKRMEALWVELSDAGYSGDIQYRTHVQDYGWMDWVSNGKMSGTTGQAKRLEAIQIRLTGEIANHCDIYYRVHSQNFGWLDWASNGGMAGTAGFGYRAEALQIMIVPKGHAAPGATGKAFIQRK